MQQRLYRSYQDFVDWHESLVAEGRSLRMEDSSLITLTPEGQEIRCLLPLILRRDSLQSLDDLQDEIDDPSCYAVILMQAGRASLAIGRGDGILCSKQIQKYMVRKSQGRSQLTYRDQKGKSRLGSRIRLRQAEQFFDEIHARLGVWAQDYDCEQLFLSCTPKLKGAWFQSASPQVFPKQDKRWRRIPFQVHNPKQDELLRIHRLLCRATLQGGAGTDGDGPP